MIYALLDCDKISQVNEVVRLNVSKSFLTPDEGPVTAIKIKPSDADVFYTVGLPGDSLTWLLDWVYETPGDKTVTVRIENALSSKEIIGLISVKTEAQDMLFCSDNQLIAHEADIMRWLPQGRSSWNFIFRRVQERIMNEIDKQRILSRDGSKLALAQVLDKTELRDWAIYMSLAMIFQSLSNQKDDVFAEKASFYEKKQFEYSQYAMNLLRMDYNKDAALTKEDDIGFRSVAMMKR